MNFLTIFITTTGSRAYGTFTEDSDYDYASVFIPSADNLLGLPDPDFKEVQVYHRPDELDQVGYSIQKFLGLCAANNPNILDILFSPRELWHHVDERFWPSIYSNRKLFLSKRVAKTYIGYAESQLKRIKTHRSWLLSPPKEKPTREAFDLPEYSTVAKEHREALVSLPEDLVSPGSKELARKEKAYESAKRTWDQYERWLKHRNPERHELEAKFGYDTKHAMHLFRLLKQGHEILEKGDLSVDRSNIDADELKEVRAGNLTYDELMIKVDEMTQEIHKAELSTKLPENPNLEYIKKICVGTLVNYLKIFAV